jgi:putative ABC transport system substrate-binding protein
MALFGCAASWAVSGGAQPSAKQLRIAIVHPVIPADRLTAKAGAFYHSFFTELQPLGLAVERYSAEGHPDRFATLADEVVSRKPDLIFVVGNDLAAQIAPATSTIPILALLIDPLRMGTVASLARPGGNLMALRSTRGSISTASACKF